MGRPKRQEQQPPAQAPPTTHSLRGRKKKKHQKEIITAKGSFTANYLNNKLEIENKYASLISLIDTIYPPFMCTLCDTVSTSRAQSIIHFNEKHKYNRKKKSHYLCIHPHCDQSFLSRATLRFHISRSHLVHWAKKPLPDPTFVFGNEQVLEEEEEDGIEEEIEEQEESVANSPANVKIEPTVETAVATPTTNTIHKNNKSHKATLPTATINHIKTPSLSPPANTKRPSSLQETTTNNKKLKVSALINDDDLLMTTPSPPPSPFSLYHPKRPSQKPQLSTTQENFLNIHYPPLQCPCCNKIFNRKTNVIKHLTEAHVGQEPYKCIYSKCEHPRLYATREGLVYHIVRVHDNEEDVQEAVAAIVVANKSTATAKK